MGKVNVDMNYPYDWEALLRDIKGTADCIAIRGQEISGNMIDNLPLEAGQRGTFPLLEGCLRHFMAYYPDFGEAVGRMMRVIAVLNFLARNAALLESLGLMRADKAKDALGLSKDLTTFLANFPLDPPDSGDFPPDVLRYFHPRTNA